MLERNIIFDLEKWASADDRKPLVLRGARQVGKTTVVNEFAKQFDQYIYVNLEKTVEKKVFESYTTIDDLVKQLFFINNKLFTKKEKTLIFIDEIQEVPEAFNLLRYFYEELPEIYVIASGSLLEFIFRKEINIPVGRVENLLMHPFSFEEFLKARKEKSSLDQLAQVPLNDFAHEKLLKLFNEYTLIGGMPAVVNNYVQKNDLKLLDKIYDNLLLGYLEDVKKYATTNNQAQVIREVIKLSFEYAGQRINFSKFGDSNYKSVDVKLAINLLEDARLVYLIYPVTTTTRPIEWDYRKKPRLHLLDIGLVNYFKGIQKEILLSPDLDQIYKGSIVEQIVGQELVAYQSSVLYRPNFWVRDKNESSAEIDYLYIDGEKIIPIEVKSSAEGHLKSLHQFMDTANHNLAIRIYSGKLAITKSTSTSGKPYFLLNLPYYLISQLERYLDWFEGEVLKMQPFKKV